MLDKFDQIFKPLYGDGDKRWPAFRLIAEKLLGLGRPVVIVETGSIRQPGNFAGDGNAALLWDWIALMTNGVFLTIDIDPMATSVTKSLCGYSICHTQDSVTALRGPLPTSADLLYLDSYDYFPGQEINAMMHQAAELGSVWSRLPEGCLIASDDCHNAQSGKHVFTRMMLGALGMKPLLESYVTVWQKETPRG